MPYRVRRSGSFCVAVVLEPPAGQAGLTTPVEAFPWPDELALGLRRWDEGSADVVSDGSARTDTARRLAIAAAASESRPRDAPPNADALDGGLALTELNG